MSKPVVFVVEAVGRPYDEAAAIATLARLTRAMATRDQEEATTAVLRGDRVEGVDAARPGALVGSP